MGPCDGNQGRWPAAAGSRLVPGTNGRWAHPLFTSLPVSSSVVNRFSGSLESVRQYVPFAQRCPTYSASKFGDFEIKTLQHGSRSAFFSHNGPFTCAVGALALSNRTNRTDFRDEDQFAVALRATGNPAQPPNARLCATWSSVFAERAVPFPLADGDLRPRPRRRPARTGRRDQRIHRSADDRLGAGLPPLKFRLAPPWGELRRATDTPDRRRRVRRAIAPPATTP